MENILDFSKTIMKSKAKDGALYADFTCGNGNDTLFLATLSENCRVIGFDIQQSAIKNTHALLDKHNIKNVTLINDSHDNLDKYLTSPFEIGVFNLGYLPHGDKALTTKTETTVSAIKKALNFLSKDGVLIIVLYPGHEEGFRESKAVEKYLCSLSGSEFNVVKYDFINKKNPPFLIAVERFFKV